MRENSLGWDDVIDSVEALQELETVFQIEIENDEAEAIQTVGDLFDVILEKLPPGHTGKCASAMAFFRLRRALGQPQFAPPNDLTFLNQQGAKAILAALREKTGLNVPSCRYARLGSIGCAVACVGGLVFAVALIAFLGKHGMLGLTVVVAAAMTMILGTIATRLDKGLLPSDCRTLGELAKQTATASYGCLVRLGARARESEMWDIVTAMLAAHANVLPTEINRDTTFYEGQKRQTA